MTKDLCRLAALVMMAGLLSPSVGQAQASSSDQPAAHAAPLSTEPLKPSIITRPDWLRQPSSSQRTKEYPPRAKYEGKPGRATLRCKVTVSGSVTDCVVASETPQGYGFGSAALRLSKHFQMRPKTVDGAPVGGATVNIGINFKL